MGNHRLMKKITFLIGSLGGGGAERVTVALADYFCESGYEVFFIVFSKVNNNYEINSKIKVDYLPENTTEIVSGGAIGVDRSARNYAKTHNIKLKEFLPEYERYGRSAPLKRNLQIIDYADEVIAFWDGMSHGTRFVIENCKRKNVPIKVYALANK